MPYEKVVESISELHIALQSKGLSRRYAALSVADTNINDVIRFLLFVVCRSFELQREGITKIKLRTPNNPITIELDRTLSQYTAEVDCKTEDSAAAVALQFSMHPTCKRTN